MRKYDPLETLKAFWDQAAGRMWTLLILWFFFSFVLFVAAPHLVALRVFGVPLGLGLPAQGALVALAATFGAGRLARKKLG
ncbi:MAG: DUF4212 domain-containing protein [Proteobacteria bacterium]|nr:DUF4212 domain-containing protein [Pseudomonadota bacterium]